MLERFGRRLVTNNETKPQIYTSEFWLMVLGQILVWVEAVDLSGQPAWVQFAVSAALAIGYMISRGLAKAGSKPV